MDYSCGKFGDCSFSRFGSVVQTDTQTDADERLIPAILVGVSNSKYNSLTGVLTDSGLSSFNAMKIGPHCIEYSC